MKLKKLIFIFAAILCFSTANAFDLNSLKNALTDGTASSLLDNLIKTDNIEISDLVGSWKSTSPAVSFKSENLLQKAGGAAAATTIENKLKPYYKKAGLDKAVFTFTADGKVSVTLSNGKVITGTVKKGSTSGTVVFNFNKLNANSKIGTFTAYVSKGTTLDVMFDATKLMQLANTLAKVSGNSTLSTASSLLNSYKGLYLGFKFAKK